MSGWDIAVKILEAIAAIAPGIFAAIGRTATDEEALQRARDARPPMIDTSDFDREQEERIKAEG